ncbi:DUF362 domain-containing protein [candidate division KSB1 bacterium]
METRRDFLKRSVKAGVGAAAFGGAAFWLKSRDKFPEKKRSDLAIKDFSMGLDEYREKMVIGKGDSPYNVTKAVIEEFGGMGNFVKQGEIVLIKPNVGWDRTPQQAANTNPEVVKALVELCKNAGAKEVIVTDVSCNDARRCFRRSQIAKMAEDAGAKVMLPNDSKFVKVNLKGEVLGEWPVFEPFTLADKVINVPAVKHHNLAKATLGMKNWYGMLGGRRDQLHQSLDIGIADLASAVRPTLTVLDGYRVLFNNGPTGGSLNDVRLTKTIAVGLDQVALDAFGAELLGVEPERIGYLRIGNQRGLGKLNYKELKISNINI